MTIIHLDHNRSQSSISPLTKTRGTGSHLFFWKIWGQCFNFFLHSCFHCSNSSLEVGYTYSPSSSSSSSSAPRDETTLASAHCYEDINHGLWGSWFGVLALEQPHPALLGGPGEKEEKAGGGKNSHLFDDSISPREKIKLVN